MIQHNKVRLLEEICIRVILIQWTEEESIDTEEWTKLVYEIFLLDICARGRRYPQLLRVTL